MDLITHDPGGYHVSLDTVWEFEQAILADPQVHNRSCKDSYLAALPNAFWRGLFDLKIRTRGNRTARSPRESSVRKRDTFAVLMGPNLRKTMPTFLMAGRKSVYLFDAWSNTHRRVRLFAEACDIDHLFLSSRQSTQMLAEALPRTACHWISEGINPANYRVLPDRDKDIDVLQLGRRYNDYHDAIVTSLKQMGRSYLYEEKPGKIIFPTREAYIDGLARSRISICVPSNRTHPLMAQGIETMTVRYLQSMVSRCLVVGHAPKETIELFGYNPVVEIDFSDPVGQLASILKNFGEHAALIEKNHRTVLENHTWKSRWQKISGILAGK